MIKRNMKKVIISSIFVLLPMIFGVIFWDKLPDTLTTHWGADGEADGWSSKAFAVFGLPLILFVFHWICVLATAFDKSNKNQNDKVFSIVLWILPILSFFSNGAVYLTAFGIEPDFLTLMPVLLGFVFMLIGNYMPKCKQNHTIGIKIKWTLANEENWNYTHRLAGKVYFFGGILVMLCALLPLKLIPLLVVVMLALVFVPVIASYIYYKKQVKNGVDMVAVPESKGAKVGKIISIIAVVIILGGTAFLMFTGDIEYSFEKDALLVEADYYDDIEINYADIDAVEYRETFDKGIRAWGFGSARLMMGSFTNDEFDNYTLYSYVGERSAVVIDIDGEKLVLGTNDDAMTLYQEILLRLK